MSSPASLLALAKGRGFLLLKTCRASGIQGRTVAGAASGVAETEKRYKTFDDLPGPSMLQNLYWFFLRGYILHTHELQLVYKKRYGPLYKSVLGKFKMINIADPEILQIMVRQEGIYPQRNIYESDLWKAHRDERKIAYGPFTEYGHRWLTLRKVLNKRMLKPAEAKSYDKSINLIVTDFMIRLQERRKESPSGDMVYDVANELYRFAFEGISYIVFETRIGCLDEQVSPETQTFIDSIGRMFKNSVYVTYLPVWTRRFLPFWNTYLEGWDNIFEFGRQQVERKMMEIQSRLEKGEEVQGEYLTYLLSSGKLTNDEIYGSVCELLMAGVDTTSNTLSWSLYHLARDPRLQQSLYEEVINAVPMDSIPTAEDIPNMPLLRAVIKETLRLYPVIPTNARIVNEAEVVIGDYQFPKKSLFVLGHYAISRDETNFPEPEKFIAQRWLRGDGMKHHPFSSIPFGYGIRACVGRRIAELEMHLALSRIIRLFELRQDPKEGEIRSIARIVLTPGRPINLQFLERKHHKV
uniref:Sterol 26-hydroxylase, mitochondrial n=1 Tax=Leptobrachium leishanense TaxID=445787 RepID=A0A8C5WC50_9ANUR